MKKYRSLLIILLGSFIIAACSNVPQAPTKTPTMSAEEIMQAAQSTAESLRRETETQWAIENPSPTPTDTPTATPIFTPTSAIPLIPPTATAEPLPYFRVGHTSYTVYKVGDPGDTNYVPMDNLYIEVCYTNEGSAIWNENYSCRCTSLGGSNIQPADGTRLGKSVSTGEKACFSFQRQGSPDTALGNHCSGFQLFSDNGTAISGGYVSACFTIY